MKRKDIIILKYKIMIPKAKPNGDEPDWESMKLDAKQMSKKYDMEIAWIDRTFEISKIKSLEKLDEGSLINHEEGSFVVKKKFKKLLKLIYK